MSPRTRHRLRFGGVDGYVVESERRSAACADDTHASRRMHGFRRAHTHAHAHTPASAHAHVHV
eukprot:5750824-Pleurochrysis_carterae.AAC.1